MLRSSVQFGFAIGSFLVFASESNAQQPQYQSGTAVGSGVIQQNENTSRHFAPPVHIAPGSATAMPANARSMQPTRKQRVVQNRFEQPPQPGLQDRLSQAFRRQEQPQVARNDFARNNSGQASYQQPVSNRQHAAAPRDLERVQQIQRQSSDSNEHLNQELTSTEDVSLKAPRNSRQLTRQASLPDNQPLNLMEEPSAISVQEPEMPQLSNQTNLDPPVGGQDKRQAQRAEPGDALEMLDRSIARVTAMDNQQTGRKGQSIQVRQAVMQEVDSGDFNWNDGAASQTPRPSNVAPKQNPSSSFRQSSILSRTSEEFDARSVQDQDDLGNFRPIPDSGNKQDTQSIKDELKNLQQQTEPPSQDDGIQPLPKPQEKQDSSATNPRDELNQLEREPRSMLDDEDNMKNFEDDEDTDKPKKTLLDKGCEEFRNELLNTTIRDIALDISPPSINVENQLMSISRSWTDRSGNIIATGTMLDMRRGYVILDNGQKLAYARLSEADLAAVSEHWNMPRTCLVAQRGSVERCWTPQRFSWTAASLCHKPLYFENIQLERYGHTHGPVMQPIRSVGHFFVSLVTLPYHTAIHPANECVYPLGLYRPGDCAPWLKDPIPISLDGMRRQGLVTTGLALIP